MVNTYILYNIVKTAQYRNLSYLLPYHNNIQIDVNNSLIIIVFIVYHLSKLQKVR